MTPTKIKITNWTFTIATVDFWEADFKKALARYLKLCNYYHLKPEETSIKSITIEIDISEG